MRKPTCKDCQPQERHRWLFRDLNIARHICNHLLGKMHTERHRMIVGSMIMLIGVLISKAAAHFPLLQIATDTCGYFIHAIGSIPFIERLTKSVK